MTGTVQDVRDENYKEFTESAGAVVAYGLATCEPCKQYDPILEETAAKFPTIKIGKAKMHVPGRCREIKKAHTFETYPTTHFFAQPAGSSRKRFAFINMNSPHRWIWCWWHALPSRAARDNRWNTT